MSIGTTIYKDDTWLITESDFDFNRCALIKTYSSNKNSTAKNEISLQVTEPSKVYVAYDEKGSSEVAPWLKRLFKRTGRRIKSNQGHEYQLYELEMRQGKVILGGNALGVNRPGQGYFVIVENLRHYNDVITRDVVDLTIDEIKYTSDRMIQLYSQGYLIHNVGTDPLFPLQLDDTQFIQNGLSVLNLLFVGGTTLTPNTQTEAYQKVISGPTDTGTTTVIKYLELIDGKLVEKQKIVPIIIPSQLQTLTTSITINSVSSKTFEELVTDLNVGLIPFEPIIENFISQARQPGLGQSVLSFIEQEALIDPSIQIYGSDFISTEEGTIFWKAFNSSRILFDNFREIDFSGVMEVNPSETTSYPFTVEADQELLTTNYVIQVQTLAHPAKLNLPKLTLHSNKKIVDAGDTITLTWSASNVSALNLGTTILTSNNGSLDVVINENTEFVLKGISPNLEAEVKFLIRIN
jgi:hypothetical protein